MELWSVFGIRISDVFCTKRLPAMSLLGEFGGRKGAARAANCSVEAVSRGELAGYRHWSHAFECERKDHRYYEIVEDTILPRFDYRYFAITDESRNVCAIQPFFVLDQDLLVGATPKLLGLINSIRRVWPRFMCVRTLMVGCAAGEGHLDNGENFSPDDQCRVLASGIVSKARDMNVSLVVLKEFPAKYRDPLKHFLRCGFTRVPSMPMTKLNIDYNSFDEYMNKALNSATRTKLRRKFRASRRAAPIEMSIVNDITSIVDKIYPLYRQVYDRSRLRFELLTKEYFCRLGREMPDKVRFFIWRQNAQPVAFTLCMVDDDAIYAEYIGLDYSVALDLHLYHYAVRDMITWSIANGYKWFRSSALNYDPKLHLRYLLDPVDLYVRHTSDIKNIPLKLLLPLIEPTRCDTTLHKFSNYKELWQ
ncbi:MAG TPA: GNAT family N-acetyltransferase [Candidatus Acidoferrum sp.]|nr:GNAT family N-acetyltransferase [Candidatus Acidoferrum sp.]